jgi:hypothetical protein
MVLHTGPLAQTLAPLLRHAQLAPDAGDDGRFAPHLTLSALLGIRGSVEVAESLAAHPVPGRTEDTGATGAADPVIPQGIDIDAPLRAVLRTATRRLHLPYRGRGRLLDADELWRLLGKEGALRDPAPARIRAVTASMAGPFHIRVLQAIEGLRSGVQTLHRSLAAPMRDLSLTVARLYDFDALLREHTEPRARELFNHIPPFLDGAFAASLGAAVARLDAGAAGSGALAAWYAAPAGFIARHIDQCRRVVNAAYQHEHDAMMGLVTAAAELSQEHMQT